MRDAKACAAMALIALGSLATPARALEVESFGGHVAIGYSRLLSSSDPRDIDPDIRSSRPPGGSLSVAGGVDYPLAGPFRLGADVRFALLGSRTVELGSQVANVDYTLFEAALLVHWMPPGAGPIARVSLGPAVESARAELSTSGGGIAFSRIAVEEVAPGMALDVTLMKHASRSPVSAGLELGVHSAFLRSATWTLVNARLAIHY